MGERQRASVRERLDQEDPYELVVSVAEAAVYADVAEQQIRDWKRRGHLVPYAYGPRRRPLFRGIDVLRAQASAERNLARTQAQNLATRHASASS